MLNKLVIPDIFFDFDTEDEYYNARFTGYIPDYNMARITIRHINEYSIDFPCHSKEEFLNLISRWIKDDTIISLEAYHSIHYYDINDYD